MRSDCVNWAGYVSKNGYGYTYASGHSRLAHRVAFELSKGPIPPGMCVCHSCDNRQCVNPNHLFIGTYKDNSQDAVKKGRIAAGERHGTHTKPMTIPRGERRAFAKLTWEDIVEIKRALGTAKQSEIAARYGVAQTTISKIARGVKWSHV